MSLAKYSPTVTESYREDKKWFEKNGGGYGNGIHKESNCDDDGYHEDGYNDDDIDRAGFSEDDYMNDMVINPAYFDEPIYPTYEKVAEEWGNKIIQKQFSKE